MSNLSDADFSAELQRRVLSDAERSETVLAAAFTDYMRGVLTDSGDIDDGETAFFVTEGRLPMSASGYAISDDGEIVDVLVTEYEPAGSIRVITKPQMARHFKSAMRFLQHVDTLVDVIEESQPAWQMCADLAEALPTAQRIRLTLVTNGRVRSAPPEESLLGEVRLTHHVWDFDRLWRLEASGRAREPITIDLEELTGAPVPVLGPKGVPDDYEAYLMLFPGAVLADIYEEYGPRLLELNVRSFLQARGKVNAGIQSTIQKEPHRFLAYNNGISMTASSVELAELPGGGRGMIRIRDLQIVNGGQTTASLHYARRKPRRNDAALDGINVMAKLSVVPEDHLLELVPLISEYANSQNTVKSADFSANHPFHVELGRISRTMLAPAADGSQHSTRWFYERARGQYADAVAGRGTPARQREFKAESPPSQVIKKTDLAKFELAWAQRPDLVCLGAEKTFREFMLRLQEKGETFSPDRSYFEQVVAKAILFKTTELIIRDLKLGGYRSQTVAYVIALISKRTAQQIDLGRIWKQQDVPDRLKDSIERLSPRVHSKLISSAGSANIAEWAKKDGAWKAIQALVWEPEEGIVARSRQKNELDLEEVWTPAAKEAALRVYRIKASGWDALLRWGITTKNLDLDHRKTCRVLRDMQMKDAPTTPSMMLAGEKILIIADEAGFEGY